MATLRQKWAIHRTYRRIQNCWQEYLAVSDKDDVQLMIQKLENFLDIFQEAYQDWSASGIIIPTDFSLDKIYGDCSEVLVNLLNTIDREVNKEKPDPGVERVADLVNKALNVAELILKDEKYRQLVANTPNLIYRILLLLEKLNTIEAKKLTLRVISTLGENDWNKIEIGRHQGFKKILRLLIVDDPELTSEIVRTIKNFLEVRDEDIQRNGLGISKFISKNRVGYVNSNDINMTLTGENFLSQYDPYDSDFNEEERDNVNTFFGSLVGGKVSNMVAELRELLFTELGRVFPNLHALASEIMVNHGDSLNDKRKQLSLDRRISFIPSSDKIASTIPRFNLIRSNQDSSNHQNDELEKDNLNIITIENNLNNDNDNIILSSSRLEDEDDSSSLTDTSSNDKRCSDNELDKYSETSVSSVATNESTENSHVNNNNSDMLKEYMRVQGALRSLTSILSEGVSQSNMTAMSKLDIIETICKLLFHNTANQAEFRKMDGYTTMLKVLDQVLENGVGERESFLKDCFNVFFIISLDGSEDMIVGNVDALNLIFRTSVSSSQLDVRQHALNCIQDLITINCLNAVAAWKVGGVGILMKLLNSAVHVDGDINDLCQVLGLEELSQASLETFTDVKYDKTVIDPNSPSLFSAGSPVAQTVDLNPAYRYLVAVTRLLEYMAVILSENNSYILKEYTRILTEICLPSKSIVVNIILRSVSRLLTDLLSRYKDVDKNLLNIYLQFIRDIFQMSEFDGLASDLNTRVQSENRMDITLNKFERVVIAEQNLLLLHIVGLLVEATGRNMELFEALQGFETLHDAIVLSSACVEYVKDDMNAQVDLDIQNLSTKKDYLGLDEDIMVADMALWLLREYMVCGLDCIESVKWMIKLTKYILANISISTPNSSNATEVNSISSSKTPVTIISRTNSLLNPKNLRSSPQRPKRATFSWLQTKVCNVVSSVLRKSDKAKQLFGEFGGLEVMLGIISHTQDMNVASAALVTVGDFFAGYEGVQQLLGNLFGYDGFLELILSSVTPVDKTCCEIVLEVATVGSIGQSLSQCPKTADPFLISSDIMPFISGLLDPTPLFTELLPFTQKRNIGFNKPSKKQEGHNRNNSRATVNSQMSNSMSVYEESVKNGSSSSLNNISTSMNEDVVNRSNNTSRMPISSSFVPEASIGNLDTVSRSSMQLRSPTLSPTTRVDRLKAEEMIDQQSKQATRKRSNSRNLGGFGLNSNAVKSNSSTINDKLRNWAGIIFRDSDAAMMALKLLYHIADGDDDKLQHYYFNLLMMLMEVNPRNKELLCANGALKFVMEVLFVKGKCTNDFVPLRQHPPSYVDLIPALGAYNITKPDVLLLFEAAYDPLSMFGHFLDGGSRRKSFSSSINQSIPSPENSTIKIDPFFIREIQMQMIYSIERISERMDPSCYFNFNGVDGVVQTAPLDKFPSMKNGYTLSMWIKVTAFFEDETGLLCYEDKSGTNTTFELYFKHMDRSNRYCLCVRTQHFPLPPEDFVFDGFNFQEIGIWHHIVFVHSKDSASLIVDGSMIQSYNMFYYPKMTGKEKIVAVIGRRGKKVYPSNNETKTAINNYFYGQIGSIYLFRGLWDEVISEKIFNQGPANSKNYRLLGVENKEVMAIHPQTYEQKSKTENEKSKRNSDSMDFTKTTGKMEGGCTVHATCSMKDIIEQIGIERCFQFLDMDSQQQLIVLRTISNLLYKSPQNVAKFTEMNGFDIIRQSLSKDYSVLCSEHFNVLLDIVSDGVMKNNQLFIINIDPLRVIIDLLANCKESVQLPVVRTLMDMLVDVPENLKTWRTNLGVSVLFDLIDNLPASLRPFTMRALEVVIMDLSVEELTKIFKYLEKDKLVNIEVKCDIICMLYKNMTFEPQFVEKIRGLKGLSILMPFLEVPDEKFRITILKMMGILMSSNVKHSRGILTKIHGFDMMRLYLVKHQLSLEFTQVLIGVGIKFYQCDPEFKNCSITALDRPIFKRSSPRSSEDSVFRAVNKSIEELIYPEIINLIFNLLKISENSELVFQVLADIKRILTPVNMRCLWEQNWLEWIIIFLRERCKIVESTLYNQRILTMTDTIVQKMMVFDISRKNSITSKTKGALMTSQNLSDKNDSEKFMLRIIDILLSYFDKNPNVNTEISCFVFRNLVTLFRYLDDHTRKNISNSSPQTTNSISNLIINTSQPISMPPSPPYSPITNSNNNNNSLPSQCQQQQQILITTTSVRRHFASTINILAYHNNSTIRTSMKSSGLFKIRDNLIKDYKDLAPIDGNEFV